MKVALQWENVCVKQKEIQILQVAFRILKNLKVFFG